MLVNTKNNKLIITFKYDPYLVEVVSHLGSRVFDNKNKVWNVPTSQIIEVVQKLNPLGFRFDDRSKELYKKKRKQHRRLERIRSGELKEPEIQKIENTQLPLFPYQRIGVGFMCAGKSVIVGDEPGLGKTIQTIATTTILGCEKILVFTFTSLKNTWKEEISRRDPNAKIVIIRGDKKAREKLWNLDAKYYILNYELSLHDLKIIKSFEWDAIIADEATRISNPNAKSTRAIKSINSKYRFALTGTPLNNTLLDIWSLVDFCEKGALGTYYQFRDRYCELNDWKQVKSYKNLNELTEKLKPFFIRRLKTEVELQLPEKLYETIKIDLTPEERVFYTSIEKAIIDELKKLGMTDRKGLKNTAVKMLRLQQATDCLKLITSETKHSTSKLDALKELLDIVCVGNNKTIIFTKFKKMAVLLMKELEHHNPTLIAGGMKEIDRNEHERIFNTEPSCKVLIMTDAGAYGLNLQYVASSIIHYDLPWSYSKTEQREGRVHRIGQKKNVTIYKMMATHTIDEYVQSVIHQKQQTSDEVLGTKDKIRRKKISKKILLKMLNV